MERPKGWVECKLPYLCNIHTGKVDANHATDNGKYRFYTCSRDYSFCDTYSFNGACIIIPGNGDIGQVYFYNGHFEAYQRTYVLEDITIAPVYLYYYMFWNWRNINNDKQYGTTIRYLRINNFNDYDVAIPPMNEQQRIVKKIDFLFSKLDKGVETLQNIKQQLKIYRQSVLKWAFEGKLTSKYRYEYNEDTAQVVFKNILVARESETKQKKYKNIGSDFDLYSLPQGWQWLSIGFISKGVEYGTSTKSDKVGKIAVLRMGNIQNGNFLYDDLVYSSDKEEILKYKLKSGDVLFNRTNSPELVGKTAIYKGEIPAIFAGYLIRINQLSYIYPKYLNFYLNSPYANICGNKVKTDGVNQSNINGTKLSSYPLPVCHIDEQIKVIENIESRFSICDKIEQIVDENLSKAKALRQSILKTAFSGKLVPQDPNDEPAEKMLERIKAEKEKIMKTLNKPAKRSKKNGR